ncbi:MAG: hypothetical protein ACE5IZ_10080 [Dehalococcoidia bacterium]
MTATKRKVSRAQAERFITEHQLRLLLQYGCRSTWELYALHGVGHCCGGVYSRSDAELRETYRRWIPDVDQLSSDALVEAIIEFEMSQMEGQEGITCSAAGLANRICDGLNRYTNQELPWLFPEALRECEVED